jgi:hypothetical protein
MVFESDPAIVIIDYTNWRGERRERRIQPLGIQLTMTPYHMEKQYILHAIDLEDADHTEKGFAMKDIHSWRPS